MYSIQTGKGNIPFISLLAIWSISLVVDLPGLAISPLLSELDKVFPNVTHLEIQLLTVLPNLFILPFILISGKLSLSNNKVILVVLGLIIFLASGIAYFFAETMTMLIIISCLLGIGCGIIIPLAAGLLAQYFTGEYRMRQLGIKSGIANFSLIISTLVVGALSNKGWHLPFIVYLTPIIPLLLSPFLTKKHLHYSLNQAQQIKQKIAAKEVNKILNSPISSQLQIKKRIWAIIGFYFLVTIGAIVIALYIPFVMQKENMSETQTGVVNASFYLMITLPGFFLSQVINTFKKTTPFFCLVFMVIGLFGVTIGTSFLNYLVFSALIGFGYGTLQPIFYDKTAKISPNADQSTLYLSYIMSANYLGITMTPFIIDIGKIIFNSHSQLFPFYFNGSIMLLFTIMAIIFRKSYIFKMDEHLY
ncbi:MAG: MFS transporter [Bacteroidales bacterium]|nr:MFS transporter [Bacteroidales bacterium]